MVPQFISPIMNKTKINHHYKETRNHLWSQTYDLEVLERHPPIDYKYGYAFANVTLRCNEGVLLCNQGRDRLNKILTKWLQIFIASGPSTTKAIHHINTDSSLPIATTPYTGCRQQRYTANRIGRNAKATYYSKEWVTMDSSSGSGIQKRWINASLYRLQQAIKCSHCGRSSADDYLEWTTYFTKLKA